MKLKLQSGKAIGDPEKAVLPTIIYCSKLVWGKKQHKFIHGKGLSFGWWDYFITFIFTY